MQLNFNWYRKIIDQQCHTWTSQSFLSTTRLRGVLIMFDCHINYQIIQTFMLELKTNNCVWQTNKISNWTWTSRIDNDCCIFRTWENENAWPPSQNLICLNIHGFWAFPGTVSTRLAPDTCYWILPVISVRICPGPEYFDKIPPRQQQRCTDGAASKAENLWAIFLQRIVIMMDICSYSGLFNLRM